MKNSLDKYIDIEYEFVCSKGHIPQSLPTNVTTKDGRLCCLTIPNRIVPMRLLRNLTVFKNHIANINDDIKLIDSS